jgi:hypothetical protein
MICQGLRVFFVGVRSHKVEGWEESLPAREVFEIEELVPCNAVHGFFH